MAPGAGSKQNNVLPVHGNEKTMNLNNLILTNIQSSHYFKVNLLELKTYHKVIDEIYNKVNHLEPWEKDSRKTARQTGMCRRIRGIRGIGAGGIVSTAFCLLYKLFTLKLTRKQLNGLITHADSPYIRALGFMYIRYTQPPADLWEWYESFLDDAEELDVKAGGGATMTIGEMLHHFLSKLEWYSTLFPRIAVAVQKDIENKLSSRPAIKGGPHQQHIPDEEVSWGEAERISQMQRSPSRDILPVHSSSRKNTSPHNKPKPEVDDIAIAIARERERQQKELQRRERPSQNRDKLSSSRDRSRDKYGQSSKEPTKDKRSSKDNRDRYEDKNIPFRSYSRRYSRTQKEHSHDQVYRQEREKSKDKDRKYRSRSPSRDLPYERSKSAEKLHGSKDRHHDSARPANKYKYRSKSRDKHREKPLNPKNHKNKEYSSTSLSIEEKGTAFKKS